MTTTLRQPQAWEQDIIDEWSNIVSQFDRIESILMYHGNHGCGQSQIEINGKTVKVAGFADIARMSSIIRKYCGVQYVQQYVSADKKGTYAELTM